MKISVDVKRDSLTRTVKLGKKLFIENYFVDEDGNVFLRGLAIAEQMMELGIAGKEMAEMFENLLVKPFSNEQANQIQFERLISEFDYNTKNDKPLVIAISE